MNDKIATHPLFYRQVISTNEQLFPLHIIATPNGTHKIRDTIHGDNIAAFFSPVETANP